MTTREGTIRAKEKEEVIKHRLIDMRWRTKDHNPVVGSGDAGSCHAFVTCFLNELAPFPSAGD